MRPAFTSRVSPSLSPTHLPTRLYYTRLVRLLLPYPSRLIPPAYVGGPTTPTSDLLLCLIRIHIALGVL